MLLYSEVVPRSVSRSVPNNSASTKRNSRRLITLLFRLSKRVKPGVPPPSSGDDRLWNGERQVDGVAVLP
jgi:hypothetical protein